MRFSHFIDLKLLKRLWALSWPTVIYSLLETSVGLVDIYLVSFLGTDEVAAVGFSRQIFLVLMIGTLSITTGTITLISQYYGARRYDGASSVAYHSLWLSVISGLTIGAIGAFTAIPCLSLLGATGVALYSGAAYLKVLMGGVVFMMINFSTNGVFRALGDTITPLKIATWINLLNVVFSYVFIFGFGPIPAFGVMGAAIGTVLARALGAIWAIILLAQPGRTVRIRGDEPLQAATLKQILQIGLPSGFSGFFRNGARILFFRILATTAASSTAIAIATIGFQIRTLAIMPALAFQVAAATLVGQCIGAGKIEEAEQFGWTAIKFCSILMAVASLLVFFFPGAIIHLFTQSLSNDEMSVWAMRCIALEQFCNCVAIVVSGVLAGAGDTRPMLRYTLIAQWCFMVPLAYLLSSRIVSWDVGGAWVAWGIAPILQLYLTFMRFVHGKWKAMRIPGIISDFADP